MTGTATTMGEMTDEEIEAIMSGVLGLSPQEAETKVTKPEPLPEPEPAPAEEPKPAEPEPVPEPVKAAKKPEPDPVATAEEVELPELTDEGIAALLSEAGLTGETLAEPTVEADVERLNDTKAEAIIQDDESRPETLATVPTPIVSAEEELEEISEPVGMPSMTGDTDIGAPPVLTRNGVVFYIDPAQLKRDVAINPNRIDEAMATNAQTFVYYATQAAQARGQWERMKAAFEILESKLDNKHRKILKDDNAKTTEAQIRAAIVGDPTWKSANSRMIDCRTVYDLASDAKEAFMMRRDAILQMAKDQREERSGELRLIGARQESANQRDRVTTAMKEKTA